MEGAEIGIWGVNAAGESIAQTEGMFAEPLTVRMPKKGNLEQAV